MINIKNHDHDADDSVNGGSYLYNDTYTKLSKNRIIFFNEIVTKQSAADLSALLLYYNSLSETEPIYIYIHSDGGDAAGLANIYDIMQFVKAPIYTVCIGKCYSAAAVMLASGTKGGRYAFKHSKIMIHGIQAGFPVPGHDITNSKKYLDFLDIINNSVMSMLAKHTGHPIEKIKKDCLRDIYLTANQALEYGLIDIVL